MISVFYDGECGLCAKEISYYRRLAPDGVFIWYDITKSSIELEAEGVGLAQGLRIIHAKDDNGVIHTGVDAFILIWKQLKKWRFLAVFVSLPVMRQTVGVLYGVFASWRFKRLKHCQLAVEEEKEKQ